MATVVLVWLLISPVHGGTIERFATSEECLRVLKMLPSSPNKLCIQAHIAVVK